MDCRYLKAQFSVAALVLGASNLAFAAGAAAPTTWQAIAIALNFVVFVALIVVFGREPITKHFANRRAGIADAIEESKQLHAAARARLDEYSARLDAFEQEKAEILAEFREIGEREHAQLVARAEQDATRIRQGAREQAAREMEQARAALEAQLVDKAVEVATDEIRGRLNPMVHNRLIDRSIENLKSLDAKGS